MRRFFKKPTRSFASTLTQPISRRFETSSPEKALSLYNPVVFNQQVNSRFWLYLTAFGVTCTTMLYTTTPEKDTFVRQRVARELLYNKHEPLTANTERFARWSFILFATGFAGAAGR